MTERALRVLSVFGTRPEAVKMAPVVRALAQTAGIESKVCVTAQHREMLDQVLRLFGIRPDYDLDLMRPNQSLAQITAAIMTHLDPIMAEFCPDWVLVVGDTTTVVSSAMLAFYRRVKVGHVEAGLRTGNKWHPWPEEINRKLATVVADLHFAPTAANRENLLREGVPDEIIRVTGNPTVDALQSIARCPTPPEVSAMLAQAGVGPGGKRLVLMTAHRRENLGQPLEDICTAVERLSERYREDVAFIYPVHLNPNVQAVAYRRLSRLPNVTLLPPLDYLPMVHTMKQAALVLTDSGGLQEEAPSLGVPTLVMRNTTERPEGIEAGTLRLVGTDPGTIVAEASRLLDDQAAHEAMARASNPFGDGHASERIVKALMEESI